MGSFECRKHSSMKLNPDSMSPDGPAHWSGLHHRFRKSSFAMFDAFACTTEMDGANGCVCLAWMRVFFTSSPFDHAHMRGSHASSYALRWQLSTVGLFNQDITVGQKSYLLVLPFWVATVGYAKHYSELCCLE